MEKRPSDESSSCKGYKWKNHFSPYFLSDEKCETSNQGDGTHQESKNENPEKSAHSCSFSKVSVNCRMISFEKRRRQMRDKSVDDII